MLMQYGASKTQTSGTPFSKLWISPRTGEVQTGPFVQVRVSKVDHLANGFESEALSPSGINNTPLPIATYNDPDALSHYLTENLSVQTILMGIRYSNRTYYEYDPEVEDLISTLSCLPGTIYRRSDRKIMLEIPPTIEGYKTQWTYGVWGERCTMPQNNEVISGQSVKFTFTLSEIQNLGRDSGLNHFELYYDIQPWREWADFVYAWLTQANHIFDQLGIQHDCKDHAYLNGFWLRFERQVMQRSKPLLRLKPTDTPIYLFVRPVPRPSDEKQIWNTWVHLEKPPS
ncbi:hypothetical protein VNI00_004906 [Paramarasmius palmivorus]|uniref:Uncharacterized protein n=1 Tax=Paramarasmius palmivorus TaxID=297713 RepID=A0AAW0DJ35_9AGAR